MQKSSPVLRRCGEPYLCDRKNHYALTDQESYSRLKPGGKKLASATAQARCLPDRYKQAPGKGVSDEWQAPGHDSPERNGAVARRCRSGVLRPLPITPMLMCLYGVMSVEDMAAASPPGCAPRVCPGKSVCPATDFHRAASTGISSLPPYVGFGAPLSPRCRLGSYVNPEVRINIIIAVKH